MGRWAEVEIWSCGQSGGEGQCCPAVMKGVSSPLPGTENQKQGNDRHPLQTAPSEAVCLEGRAEGGGHWDCLLLIRLCREHSWVEFISTVRWFILRMSKYTSLTYLNGKE